jgi:hypothetical protein
MRKFILQNQELIPLHNKKLKRKSEIFRNTLVFITATFETYSVGKFLNFVKGIVIRNKNILFKEKKVKKI